MSDAIIKLVLVGIGGVGKSAITISYVSNIWVSEYDPTIEDWHRKQVCIDEKVSMVDILDTAGQEEYSTMQDQWFQQGQGYLMVYSIINRKSFTALPQLRKKIERCRDISSFPLVLVGNKRDMDHERVVSREEGMNLAKEFGCPFYETSAKESPEDVAEAFEDLIRQVRLEFKSEGVTPDKLPSGSSSALSSSSGSAPHKKRKICPLL